MKKTFAALSSAALIVFVIASCGDDATPTGPTPAPTATPAGTITMSPKAPEPATTPTPGVPISVSCSKATGVCTFETDHARPVHIVCTPPLQQWVKDSPSDWGEMTVVVNDGDSVQANDACNKIPANDCSPRTVKPQIDLHSAGRHIGHNGPTITIPQKLDPKECEECEPEWTADEPDYGECLPIVGADSVIENGHTCERSATTIYRNQCDERTRESTTTEPCECPCVEPQEIPQVPQAAVWEEEILEGRCEVEVDPIPTISTRLDCHQIGTQLIVLDYQCSEDETKTRELCRNVACPPPAARYCFYNISGQPKEFTCEHKLGGNPLRFGEWGRWPDGPPSDHCRFTVPGIFSDLFRQFQLTPGQSDPDCNSY
jgi:hypothetical protein